MTPKEINGEILEAFMLAEFLDHKKIIDFLPRIYPTIETDMDILKKWKEHFKFSKKPFVITETKTKNPPQGKNRGPYYKGNGQTYIALTMYVEDKSTYNDYTDGRINKHNKVAGNFTGQLKYNNGPRALKQERDGE